MLPEITINILQFLQEEAITHFPAFPEAFGQLFPVPAAEYLSEHASEHSALYAAPETPVQIPLATDGTYLYTDSSCLHQMFLSNTEQLKHMYLHIHLHCLCLHVIQPDSVNASDWDLACDLSVALLSDLLKYRSKTNLYRETESLLYAAVKNRSTANTRALHLLKKTGWLTAQMLLPLLKDIPELRTTAASCICDSHMFWHRPEHLLHSGTSCSAYGSGACSGSSVSGKSETLQKLEQIVHTWQKRLPDLQKAAGSGRRGRTPGSLVEEAELRRRDTMDYHRFLRQFAVAREEAILDMDAFDYIPYYYGLACYGNEISAYTGQNTSIRNIPFLEPLEYKEVNRLDEFAIAIDTSASCSGTIVRRFLEETWSILRQRENFFSKIRIHLIQCDSMIQDHQIFTSSEQLEEAMENIKIHGLGNTDFRPVFEYLEKLIRNQEIRHLRGLLYFTDGDGIFPSHAPEWDTAFVFLNRETEKHAIPDWGIRLNLHIPDLEIAPIRDRI